MSTGPRSGRWSAITRWWKGARSEIEAPAAVQADASRWCNVEPRFGGFDVGSPPSNAEIATVVDEVLNEAELRRRYPDFREGDLEEHPNAWMEAAHDDGPTYVLDLYRGGMMQFAKYADGEPDVEEFLREKHGVTVAEAERLWRALRDGRIAEVEAAFPES
jgi:hypothetical protein